MPPTISGGYHCPGEGRLLPRARSFWGAPHKQVLKTHWASPPCPLSRCPPGPEPQLPHLCCCAWRSDPAQQASGWSGGEGAFLSHWRGLGGSLCAHTQAWDLLLRCHPAPGPLRASVGHCTLPGQGIPAPAVPTRGVWALCLHRHGAGAPMTRGVSCISGVLQDTSQQ